jgi:CheY-like chemotaxis protein
MALISLFSAACCHGQQIADALAVKLGWKRIDEDLLSAVEKKYNTPREKVIRAMRGPPFVFNQFTHRREQVLAQLKSCLSDMLEDDQIIYGYAALLVPADLNHALRICLLADTQWRAKLWHQEQGGSLQEAQKVIHEEDRMSAQWTQWLFGSQPWSGKNYDAKVPVNETGLEGAVELISKHAKKVPSSNSGQALQDFRLAAEAELVLVKAKHYHSLRCRKGSLTVIVDEYVMNLDRLKSELRRSLAGLTGIDKIHVKTGPNYRPVSVFSNLNFDFPQKVLLVDDEKDFVVTLSERLEMRDLEPVIAHGGEEALHLIDEEEPEVIVLDLNMPGIDGVEVLKRVRSGHPEVKVIILTGHGSVKDKQLCMDLGAFAYLEKPVDINELSALMTRAKRDSDHRCEPTDSTD